MEPKITDAQMSDPVSTEIVLVPLGSPIAKQAITQKHALIHPAAINFADATKAKSVMIARKKDKYVHQTLVRPHVPEAHHYVKDHVSINQQHMYQLVTIHP